MQCDMCGKELPLVRAIVEGSEISVCDKCSKFGKVVSAPISSASKKPILRMEESYEIINRDFPRLVKEARERMNLNQHQLAEKMAERESVVHRVESGLLEPSVKLAKKLENTLKIKLIEFYTEQPSQKVNFKKEGLTIGDLLSKLKK